ncbi:choline transporter-like protein 1 isoform X2 [Prorops nasuta]|uniref:choline transporter-like protein 1 isoform X2 n=1 Tax=Prorops nasuta TaxID=863751 RepID=UPI0034CD7D89
MEICSMDEDSDGLEVGEGSGLSKDEGEKELKYLGPSDPPDCTIMGCCGCSDDVSSKSPESDAAFNSQYDEIFVRKRSCTDILAAIVFLIVLVVFGFLLATSVKKGDIFRVVYGYDDCANVCGRVTPGETDPVFACKGGDMTRKPYLLVKIGEKGVKSRECVGNCSSSFDKPGEDKVVFLNRCIPKKITDAANSVLSKIRIESFFREASTDLGIAWRELIYLLLIALAISVCILVAFRYIVQWVIYIVLVGVVIACIGGTTYLWLSWRAEKKAVESGQLFDEDSSTQAYFIYAIIMSVVTVIILLIILVMRKRIALVMQLFREAGKAVYSMPVLLLQPIYTYLLIGLASITWIYCILWIESAGTLYKNTKNHFHYRKDTLIIVTRWYNIFIYFVLYEFFMGCQHMVVALSVSRWFFTRDKKQLSLPVLKGFSYLTMYHLGTVAFGALVIGLVRIVRAILSFVQKRLKSYNNDLAKGLLWCCQCCLWCFECALKFLTRNAYIETAIYGCGFCAGGRKAFSALSQNILRVAAINSVGDFVLFLGKVLVVTLTVVAGIFLIQKKEGLNHPWVPITLAGIFAFLVAHCFISVYEMVIDSIFLCFCEDCEKNDGVNRPYFMSRGLMEFVNNSKKALKVDQTRNGT